MSSAQKMVYLISIEKLLLHKNLWRLIFSRNGDTLKWKFKESFSHSFDESSRHFALLKVRLSVQVLGVDVAQAVLVRRPKHEDVRGDHLVAGEVNKIAHPHFGP